MLIPKRVLPYPVRSFWAAQICSSRAPYPFILSRPESVHPEPPYPFILSRPESVHPEPPYPFILSRPESVHPEPPYPFILSRSIHSS